MRTRERHEMITVGDLCRAIEDGRLCPGVENGEYVVRSTDVRRLRWDDQLWHTRTPREAPRRPAARRSAPAHPARAS
ncbi:MAG TPA: hypothetical protein VIC85_00435 [Ktedonobacterales bacterium]|jgi:hypothetical protein